MSRRFRAEQERARARMRDWRRGRRFRARIRLYLTVFALVGSLTFVVLLVSELR